MGTITIPNKFSDREILILDDEPEHIYWLVDYIETKGFSAKIVINAKEAIETIENVEYAGYVLDLNIPLGGWQPNVKSPNSVYDKYRGFYIAKYIRSQGVTGRRVLMYSAHSNDEINHEVSHLYVDYVAKGRAAEFKLAIGQLISLPRLGPTL